MPRTMYDSTSAADIPPTAVMVAGYVDGLFAWSAAAWARFPHATQVRIACFAASDAGQVLDVEAGCADPSQAPAWCHKRWAAGQDPTVYVNRANYALVRGAFAQAGEPQPHYWLAAYDNLPQLEPGIVAKQYADAALAGGHYDLSIVADYWPGVDPIPHVQEDEMLSVINWPGENANYLTDGLRKRRLIGPADENLWRSLYPAIPATRTIGAEVAAAIPDVTGQAAAAGWDIAVTPKA